MQKTQKMAKITNIGIFLKNRKILKKFKKMQKMAKIANFGIFLKKLQKNLFVKNFFIL